MGKKISLQGIRQNNLDIDFLDIPRNRLVTVTGVSGSGKSSLVFDTIYAEGRKRLLDCFSLYERSRMKKIDEADVDSIEGLSPVIAIEQKSSNSKNPRSTVGTVTSVNDYLRLLFSRASDGACPHCGKQIPIRTNKQILNRILERCPEGTEVRLFASVIKSADQTWGACFEDLIKKSFKMVRVNGELLPLSDREKWDESRINDVQVLIDICRISQGIRNKLLSLMTKALDVGDGAILIDLGDRSDLDFYTGYGCPECKLFLTEMPVSSFSFNTPAGACPQCTGLGTQYRVDPDLVIPDKNVSLSQGAINLIAWRLGRDKFHKNRQIFEGLAEKYNFSLDVPVKELPDNIINIILYGTKEKFYVKNYIEGGKAFYMNFDGIINIIMDRFSSYSKDSSEEVLKREDAQLMRKFQCPDCHGTRLKKIRQFYRVGQKSLGDLSAMSFYELKNFLQNIDFSAEKEQIGRQIIKKIISRLEVLIDIGVGYLSLDRETFSLSGGEQQRVRLTTQLDSNLVDIIYILDEPSVGLHIKDIESMVKVLKSLRDKGNSVIVVEHEEEIIRASDYLIELGPGAGVHGGKVTFHGDINEMINDKNSVTGSYLSGRNRIVTPMKMREEVNNYIEISGAAKHNLKNLSLKIPLGRLVCVTGVSGSGKSTLVNKVLYDGLMSRMESVPSEKGAYGNISGYENISAIVRIDQSPISRNSRSNPATYVEIFDHIRSIFAGTKRAKENKYKPAYFSFNEVGGRCDNCAGMGTITTQMHFMDDVEVLCEVCQGKRFKDEILEIRFKDKNIADVLDMSIEESAKFFGDYPAISEPLNMLNKLGMGYLKLGQSSTTLSGGEAQRLKLAYELSQNKTGKGVLYILDEPTTGLHFADIQCLLDLMHGLADRGNTVVVIEHNLEVIKTADYIFDLGPEGGEKGGEIVAEGILEDIINSEKSYTGKCLKRLFLKDQC